VKRGSEKEMRCPDQACVPLKGDIIVAAGRRKEGRKGKKKLRPTGLSG